MPQPNIQRFSASFAQQRLWFIDNFEAGSGLYTIPAAWRLRGDLDVRALQQAFNELVRRHEVLRTVVLADDEQEVVQVVAATLELAISYKDLSATQESQIQLSSLLQAEAQVPFDLSKGPLLRYCLICLAPEAHVLMLTLHHIVSDAWSMGVLARELQVLYTAFIQGQPSPLTELPIQYADYAYWQREWLQGEVLQSLVDFWRKTLEGAPPLIDLPLDRPRPTQLSHRGSYVTFEVDASLTAELRKLCQQAQVTPFMATAALLNVLLHRYSRQDDICIGYPVAGRQRKELEELIGYFVNTLVLRTRVDRCKSFLQLLAQVRESVLDADEHQALPFEKLVEELKPDRSLNHSPLFQVMLAYNNANDSCLSLPSLEITPFGFGGTQTAKFDLTLELTESDNLLLGAIEYNTDLFDRSTIERMVGHFKTLLEAVVANPQSRIQDLPLLTKAERHQMLVEWNDTKADFPQDKCIHQLFEEQVGRTPDAVAVVFEDQQLTYTQLNAKANQLARHLRNLGVKPDSLVAICVERSLEMVVGLLGILKAGGAYVPLDPDAPAERLARIVEDAYPSVVLTLKDPPPSLDLALKKVTRKPIVLDLTDVATDSGEPSFADPSPVTEPHHLAYVIYTSGSTGHPKGVLVEHRNVVRLFSATSSEFAFEAKDVWTLFHSIAFDFSVWEIWGALAFGGRLVVVPLQTARDADAFFELLCTQGVTILNQTPSAFRALISAQASSRRTHFLRYVIFGGEALEMVRLKPWYSDARNARTRLVNMYGITETTVHVTYCALAANDVENTRGSPIGRRIGDLRLYLLDSSGEPVPVGAAGEIYVGGAGVARGYMNRTELTAERFLASPFVPGDRLYRSGDLARYMADGSMEFIGRVDDQVKIRGFRIELGEVEAALRGCEGVREAVVLAREDVPGDKRLVAYVVPMSGALAIAELRTQISSFLPDYMVPSAMLFLDTLPLSRNGKVDRKALQTENLKEATSEGAPGCTEAERLMVEIWMDLLRLEQVGVHDNFFSIGGHSLLAVSLAKAVSQRFGVFVAARKVFLHPTIAELALCVSKVEVEATTVGTH